MKTPQENQNEEGKLGNRTAHIAEARGTSEGPRKWILYLVGDKDPLLGFVHASTAHEAVALVAKFGRKVVAVEADAPAMVEQMTPERIARHFELFHTIIPAYSEDGTHRRTAYFYRREAIQWARMARQCYSWETSFRQTCRNFAKSYLASYRFIVSVIYSTTGQQESWDS